ncbi:MAG: diaminopimelate epimerase [Lachnospiraceae bacterium]|nr:diaminopimelate epimerase [Lachnospiraceae bacterium]
MKFTKMHGCGNDYIYVNGFTEKVDGDKKPEVARRLSHRQHGIGGDGLIFINPSQTADFEMEMYNADGTRAQMCGNGIRCVGKYVYDKGMTDKTHIAVESGGQIKYLDLMTEADIMYVRVNMGSPILTPSRIPVIAEGKRVVNSPMTAGNTEYYMTCVSMGNPHAVIFTKGVREIELDRIGPVFEYHERFPERVNTEFVEILDKEHCFLRVWERGAGETLACGTGACAAVVAAVLNHLTENRVWVTMPGGDLLIEWDRENDVVYMTGPAVTVFEGQVCIDG